MKNLDWVAEMGVTVAPQMRLLMCLHELDLTEDQTEKLFEILQIEKVIEDGQDVWRWPEGDCYGSMRNE